MAAAAIAFRRNDRPRNDAGTSLAEAVPRQDDRNEFGEGYCGNLHQRSLQLIRC